VIVVVLWRTGLRASELCALELADYDAQRARLTVRHGKGDKYRVVGVPDDARLALDDWLLVSRGTPAGPLFPSERGGHLTYAGLSQMLGRLKERSGAGDVHAHRFRHTFAIGFLRAGGDIYTLSRLLGHSTLAMTSKYLRALKAEEAADDHVRILRRRG
jgi:integrase